VFDDVDCGNVFDSYSKTFTLTPSLEIQLSAIYGQGKTNLLIKLPEVQQQTNGYGFCVLYVPL
jgi:tRNA A37 threonylcarbamoyltransferase TsaD